MKADIQIIPVKNYTHALKYDLPVKPSPNLPNYLAVRLYPSLCFFEATSVSVGRGTEFPFQVLGYPNSKFGSFIFTPKSIPGMDLDPLHKNQSCFGEDFRSLKDAPRFNLSFFLNWYHQFPKEKDFLTREAWFDLLMGNDIVLKLIREGKSEKIIHKSWERELKEYKEIRKKYLLYPE